LKAQKDGALCGKPGLKIQEFECGCGKYFHNNTVIKKSLAVVI